MARKEGALGSGVGGNCSSSINGSKKITRRYPGRGSVYYSGGFRYSLSGAFKQEEARECYIYIKGSPPGSKCLGEWRKDTLFLLADATTIFVSNT